MERLTKRLPSGAADYNYPKSCYIGDRAGADRISQSAFRQRCVEQLADYEDTGLTPEEFHAYWVFLEDMIGEQKASEALDRFRQLVKADKDGRLVVLPVRPVLTQSIGSMLYIIEDGEIVEDSLCEALVGMGSNGEINIFYTTLSDQISFEQADIGKTVFLTREEAKKALEAMKDE